MKVKPIKMSKIGRSDSMPFLNVSDVIWSRGNDNMIWWPSISETESAEISTDDKRSDWSFIFTIIYSQHVLGGFFDINIVDSLILNIIESA